MQIESKSKSSGLRHILFDPFVILFMGLSVALIVPVVPFQFGHFCQSFHCINGYGSSIPNIVFGEVQRSAQTWLLGFALVFALRMIFKGFMLRPVAREVAVVLCCMIMMIALPILLKSFANRTTLGGSLVSWIEYQDRFNYETNFSKSNDLKSIVAAELTSVETDPSKDSISFTVRLSNHSDQAIKELTGHIFVGMGNQIETLYLSNVPPINPGQSIDLHLTQNRPYNATASTIDGARPLPKFATSNMGNVWSLWQPLEMRLASGQTVGSHHIF